MKTRIQFCLNAGALIAAAVWLGTAASNSAAEEKSSTPPAHAADSNAVPQSVFVMPANGSEGRDPFFPKSEHPWIGRGHVVVATETRRPGVDVVYIAFSGTPEHRLATITVNGNGRTMAVGETAQVSSRGNQIEIRCVEITEEKVVVEVNGEGRDVPFRTK